MKPVAGRLFLLGIAVFVSLVFFLPSTPLFSAMPEWWKQHLPNKGITLGLDLQGGIHLVLEVEAERAIEIKLDRDVTSMAELFAEKKLQVETVKRTGPTVISVGPVRLTVSTWSFFSAKSSAMLVTSRSSLISIARSASTSSTKWMPPCRSRPSVMPLLGKCCFHHSGMAENSGVEGKKNTSDTNTAMPSRNKRPATGFMCGACQSSASSPRTRRIWSRATLILAFSATCKVTVSLPTFVTVPQIPPLVTTLSPFLSWLIRV